MSNLASLPIAGRDRRRGFLRILDGLSMPVTATLLGFFGGAIIIWITSGFRLDTVVQAYAGMVNGAFFKTRGLSESLVATVPYIFLSLAVGLGFKAGLFNIGVEGQFYIGAISAAWVGTLFTNLPAIVYLPLVIVAGAVGGAVWAIIPGYLKARTGAHEVINTIMMNYIAFRLVEYLVSNPVRDPHSSAVQTPRVSPNAELWSLWQIPERLADPLNALGVAIVFALVAFFVARAVLSRPKYADRIASISTRRAALLSIALVAGTLAFFFVPILVHAWWPLTDEHDRLHIGIFFAIAAAVLVWWLLFKTTLGFEMRTVGANPDAAKYAGVNITRNIVFTMTLSGALAGIAGTTEVLGVSTCRCLPLFFSSGYGFDSIAISLLAKNNPFAILGASFLFGAMRNGSDLMELTSGVSKYVISLIQALVLLFVAAPAMVRYLLRMRAVSDEQETLTRGWGG
jgi:general nucleoside transport system permease protein